MNLKYNINKIHGDLLSQFLNAEIKIEEKSNLKFGNYIEVSIINEGKDIFEKNRFSEEYLNELNK